MLVSTAYAQAAGAAAPGGTDMLVQFAPILAIMVVFYFLLLRPQQKKAKEHKNMLDSLRRGDRVITGGGIFGMVVKVAGEEATVELAPGVRVKVVRSTITQVVAKTEPANDEAAGDEPDEAGESADGGAALPGMAKPQPRRPTARK